MRMSKTKLIAAGFGAALSLGTLSPASALAKTAGWVVHGTLLTGSKELASTAKVTENPTLKWVEIGENLIECAGPTVNAKSPMITAPNKGSVASLEFTKCKSLMDQCSLASETIGTLPISTETTLEGALGTLTKLSPATKNQFATFRLEGPECASEGIHEVAGRVLASGSLGQDENAEQEFKITTGPGELTIDGIDEATLRGTAKLKLTSAESWSFS